MLLDWLAPAVSIIGSVGGSYVGVRVAITRLDVEVKYLHSLSHAHDITLDSMAARLSGIQGDLERMKQDIGTHDTGLRGDSHAHSNLLSQHELRLHLIDKQRLRDL